MVSDIMKNVHDKLSRSLSTSDGVKSFLLVGIAVCNVAKLSFAFNTVVHYMKHLKDSVVFVCLCSLASSVVFTINNSSSTVR